MQKQNPKRHKKYKRLSRQRFGQLPPTEVVPNKKKYKRNPKHKEEYDENTS